MEKLPPTSYVRMVDIWLICAQIIPFIEVILLTAMEHFNDPSVVNHHGQARKLNTQPQVNGASPTLFGGADKGSNGNKIKWLKITGRTVLIQSKNSIFLFSERKIVPATLIGFSIVYWSIGFSSHFDLYKTYED